MRILSDRNTVLEQASQTSALGGSIFAVVSGVTLSDVGVIAGIVVAVLGLAAQTWLGMRRDARECQLHREILGRLARDIEQGE